MTENELKSMTVVQLKQYAKENHITLGAGLDKAGIVAKIYAAEQDQPAGELSEQQSFLAPAEQEPAVPAEEVREEEPPAEPKFQAAWHNTDAPRYSAKPSYQAPGAPSFGPRPAWQSTTPSGTYSRAQVVEIAAPSVVGIDVYSNVEVGYSQNPWIYYGFGGSYYGNGQGQTREVKGSGSGVGGRPGPVLKDGRPGLRGPAVRHGVRIQGCRSDG